MGIDIYARWKGITEEEKNAQHTGFSTWSGHVGYLREAYHGDPYATRVLVPEAFESEAEDGEPIPAKLLIERLPKVLEASFERQVKIYEYKGSDIKEVQDMMNTLKSFVDFVLLCAKKESETGEPVKIVASY